MLTTGAFRGVQDDWAHGDIDLKNVASVKLFEGLEAVHEWDSYWYRIDLTIILA